VRRDLAKAIEAQKGFRLMPLSDYLREGLACQLPKPGGAAIFREQRQLSFALSTKSDTRRSCFLPVGADNDDAFVSALHQIGLSVAKGFDWQSLDEASSAA